MTEPYYDGAIIYEDEPELPAIAPAEATVDFAELLTADEFPFTKADLEVTTPRSIDRAASLETGRWLIKVLSEAQLPTIITSEHLRRAHVLGLLASERTIHRIYGSLSNFNALCGVEVAAISNEYDDYDDETALALLIEAHETVIGDVPLTASALEILAAEKRAPNYHYFLKRFGGLSYINDRWGYPDVRLWGKVDYIRYGMRFIEDNGQKMLSDVAVNILSAKNLGPHTTAIRKRFGTFNQYQTDVLNEFKRQDTFIEEIKHKVVSTDFFQTQLDDPTIKKEIVARYELFNSCSRGQPVTKSVLLSTTTLTETLLKLRDDISLGEIELTARELEIFDVIWPQHRTVRTLRVRTNELEKALRNRSNKLKAYRS